MSDEILVEEEGRESHQSFAASCETDIDHHESLVELVPDDYEDGEQS